MMAARTAPTKANTPDIQAAVRVAFLSSLITLLLLGDYRALPEVLMEIYLFLERAFQSITTRPAAGGKQKVVARLLGWRAARGDNGQHALVCRVDR